MNKHANVISLLAASAVTATSAMAATAPSPYIQNYSPTTGAPGTVITVNGSGFTGLNGAWVGNAHDSTVYVLSDTVVKVTVPADATTGKIALHNTANWSWSPGNFTVAKSGTVTPPATTTPVSTPAKTAVVVSGAVTGATDAKVMLAGNSVRMATANSSGTFAFTGVADGTYTLSPTTAGHVFTPNSVAAKVKGASVTGIKFAGVATSSSTYSIAGTITGATVAGVTVTLNGVNVGAAATDLSGNYSFSGLAAGTYTVAASLAGHKFSAAKIVSLSKVDSASNDFTSLPADGNLTLAAVNPLPAAAVGTAYTHTLVKSITGVSGTIHYQSGAMATGTPPLGMIVNPNGNLTGTPAKAGTYTFDVCAADSSGNTTATCAATTITVGAATTSTPPVVTPPVVTPPVVVTPPPVTTPPVTTPPAAGTSWVYYNGAFDWPGDYSFVATPNYADTTGAPLSGTKDIKVTLQSAYGGWLPYAQNWAFNSAPYTKLTFALKPTVSGQRWVVYFVKVGDVPVGITLDVSDYGPAPVAGKWGVYTVPLKDLGVLGTVIYKFAIQDQSGLNSNSWYVDNVGFVP
jgi:Carboxypeptidase regulatory-like domain